MSLLRPCWPCCIATNQPAVVFVIVVKINTTLFLPGKSLTTSLVVVSKNKVVVELVLAVVRVNGSITPANIIVFLLLLLSSSRSQCHHCNITSAQKNVPHAHPHHLIVVCSRPPLITLILILHRLPTMSTKTFLVKAQYSFEDGKIHPIMPSPHGVHQLPCVHGVDVSTSYPPSPTTRQPAWSPPTALCSWRGRVRFLPPSSSADDNPTHLRV